MIARVARFEGVDVEGARRTFADADDHIRPIVEALAGYRGHLELVSAGGEVLSVTFFDSSENAQAAESTFDEEMPRKLGDVFKGWAGRRVSVGHFEVIGDSRR